MDADSANGPGCVTDGCTTTSVPRTNNAIRGATLIAYRGVFDDKETGIRAKTSHKIGSNQKLTFGGEYSDGEVTVTNSYPAEVGRER